MRFMIGVVAPALVAGKVVVEEVCGNINADHVADVKVAHHGQGKENDEPAVLVILYEILDRQRYKATS